MKPITKVAWDKVHQKSCDIINSVMAVDDTMADIHTTYMFEILDDLETEFGIHPEIIATRADFMDNDDERRKLYKDALSIARERDNGFEVSEILDSLRQMDED